MSAEHSLIRNPQSAIRNPILAIVGPTAVGKSDLAMALAERLPAVIIVADSQQIYRGLDIGTGKPTPEMRRRVDHGGVDLAEPSEQYNVGRYVEDVGPVIQRAHREGRLPIVVGGTGLYVRALQRGLWSGAPADAHRRALLERTLQEQGPEVLHQRLQAVDAVSADRIDRRNTKRVIRALEVFEQTGRPFSDWLAETRPAVAGDWHVVGVKRSRESLRARIAHRVAAMVQEGWPEEVRGLLNRGVGADSPGFQALGYREMAEYLAGTLSLGAAKEKIVLATGQYAKRQETWFRKEKVDLWIDADRMSMDDAVTSIADGGWRIADSRSSFIIRHSSIS